MNKIVESVSKSIKDDDKIVVAVSGGADSMVLLWSIVEVSKQRHFQFRVISIDHMIRGNESSSDAKFVDEFCKRNKVDCKIVKIDIPKLAKQSGQTLEECARNQRYKVLFENLSADEILFVAHNKDDQVETVFMHIARGSGIDGARGMPKRENLKRPLIDFSKKEIVEFAKKNRIQFVTDSTNECIDYSRNYIRKEILPTIEQKYPNFANNVVRFAEYCRKCEEFIASYVQNDWFVAKNNQVLLKNCAFLQNELVVAKAIKSAYQMLGEYSDLESKHIEIVIHFQRSCANGSIVNLPHSVVAEKRAEGVYFYKTSENYCFNEIPFVLGKNVLSNGQIIEAVLVKKEQVKFGDGQFYCDYNKLGNSCIWRTRKTGDIFKKLGSIGGKKLNDYYSDKKLTISQKNTQVLLANGSEILFVVGCDISDKIKIDQNTIKFLRIKVLQGKDFHSII